ncbi:hypothetical protein HYV72_01245 [Candidatus Uhrbacteria bacterium]|nr:hypothetical protein [Candidatus Uhrbacteria bacterium]
MAQPIFLHITKRFVLDNIVGVFGFPLWWYTEGLSGFLRLLRGQFAQYRAHLGVSIWIRNIFVPMYGSYDFGGRLISFFMRSVMIVARAFALVLLTCLMLVIIALYIALPIVIALLILYHTSSFLYG